MANHAEHQLQADRTRKAREHLDTGDHPEWIITTAFYEAVHHVESMLAVKGLHSINHHSRFVLCSNHLRPLYPKLKALYNASRVARYICDEQDPQRGVDFRHWCSSARRRDLVKLAAEIAHAATAPAAG